MIIIYSIHFYNNTKPRTTAFVDATITLENSMKNKIFGMILLLTGLTLGTQTLAQTQAPADTAIVWQHHIDAWESKSLSDIVQDYNEDSVLVINNQVFRGPKDIAHVFTRLFEIFANGDNQIDTPLVFERFVYITWHFQPTGKSVLLGTDTFVIENGKIKLQTIASDLYNGVDFRN